MIGYLTGTVLEILEKTLILQTAGGVGYSVFPAGSLLSKAKKEETLSCYIYTRVAETEISLYGFSTLEEKMVFEKLLGISGVGPKIGLQIISGPVDQFFAAVEAGDDAFIAQTPGIGKKMAQKIIVELQGKLNLKPNATLPQNSAIIEAVQALEGLGYDTALIQTTLESAPPNSTAEDLVKYFLTHS